MIGWDAGIVNDGAFFRAVNEYFRILLMMSGKLSIEKTLSVAI